MTREPEDGRLVPPYPREDCAAEGCDTGPLGEEHGAYLHKNRETGKLIVFCGPCSQQAQMYDSLRLPLVAL